MSFEAPLALALLAALPLAALLLLRRLRRRERPAAAFFLLRDLVDALPPLPRSILLRRRLRTAFFLAALACAALAAAGPVLGRAGDPPQRAVLLLDTFAPGRDGSGRAPAWERTTRAAEAVVRSFRSDDRVLLLRAGGGVVGPGFVPPRRAARLIRETRPGSLAPDVPAALDLLAAAARGSGPALVGIATASPGLWEGPAAGRDPSWRIVAAPPPPARGPNHALLDVEVRPDFLRPGRVALFCRTGLFAPPGSPGEEVELVVSVDGRELARRRLALAPGETRGAAFPALEAGAGVLRAELLPGDGAPGDDVFLAPLRGRGTLPALLVSEENRPLEAALRAIPGLDLTVARPSAGPPPDGTAPVRVYDRVAPAEIAGNLLVIAPPAGLPGFGYRGEASRPETLRVEGAHFLLDGVDLRRLLPARLPVYEMPPGMEVLASADSHPLLAAGRAPGGARVAFLAFDPREGDGTLDPSFPILVANLVSWLAESPAGARSYLAVGDALPEELGRRVRRVIDPEGRRVPEPAGGWGGFRFAAPGRWRVEGRGPGASGAVFVNLLDEAASAAAAAAPAAATPEPVRVERPFRAAGRGALAVAALVLLLAEQLVAPRSRAGRLP